MTLLNNRYQILQTLGSGGFGDTFLAEDTHLPSRRRCVIKQLRFISHDPQLYQTAKSRFEREAAILEQLGNHHGQIPDLYAYFSENGQFYLAQEFIVGPTLTQMIEASGSQPESTVKAILLSLLPVLDYVHHQRMVHRDIKPDNIILREQDNQPVLIDFGAVKESVNQGGNLNSVVVGTPGFMSPEQAQGQPIYSSDLYGLGLTAIYLLTAKLPSEFPLDPRTGELQWQQAVSGVSPGMMAVLEKAIQSKPAYRFATAQEMLNALQNQTSAIPAAPLSHVPTVAIAPGQTNPVVPSPLIRQPSRNPLMIGLAFAGVFVAITVALGLLFNRSQTRPIAASSPVETPVNSPTPKTAESPLPEATESPTEPISRPSPASPPVREQTSATPPSGEDSANNNSPSPIPNNSPIPTVENSPSATPENTQEPAPEDAQSTDNLPNNIPAFPVGTSRQEVEARLGKPDINVNGLWKTRALVYHVVPEQVDLGYLFDRQTGNLRQTEASFATNLDQQLMARTLTGMLGENNREDIQQGLQQVYQGRRNSYRFTTGGYRGLIVRQECDRIYIAVWDAPLHDFDVAGSRRC